LGKSFFDCTAKRVWNVPGRVLNVPPETRAQIKFLVGGVTPPHQHAFAMYLSMKDREVSVELSDASQTPIELSDASNDVGHMHPFLFQSPDKPIIAISCIFLSAPQKR